MMSVETTILYLGTIMVVGLFGSLFVSYIDRKSDKMM